MDQIPRRERKTSFSCSSHAPGQSRLCSGLFFIYGQNKPSTSYFPALLRYTALFAADKPPCRRLPRREPLLAVLPPAVLTDGSPFRKMSARLTCSILATFQITTPAATARCRCQLFASSIIQLPPPKNQKYLFHAHLTYGGTIEI